MTIDPICESGGTGRRAGLRIQWDSRRGSSPLSRTTIQILVMVSIHDLIIIISFPEWYPKDGGLE